MVIKKCEGCSKRYKARENRVSRFCSKACFGFSQRVERVKSACEYCGKCIVSIPSTPRKYCSKHCKGKVHGKNLKPYYGPRAKSGLSGVAIWNWKGDRASYRSIHHWVSRWKGKPKHCEFCGKTGGDKRYHWANKSKKYLRDLEDWIRLCAKCHWAFDRK